VLRLTLNMKFVGSFLPTKQGKISKFDKWILSIGDGDDKEDENCERKIGIYEDLLISSHTYSLMTLIDFACLFLLHISLGGLGSGGSLGLGPTYKLKDRLHKLL